MSHAFGSSPPHVFLEKGALTTYSNLQNNTPAEVMILKWQSNFIEITLRHECSAVNLMHIFGTPFYKNAFGGLLLCIICIWLILQSIDTYIRFATVGTQVIQFLNFHDKIRGYNYNAFTGNKLILAVAFWINVFS